MCVCAACHRGWLWLCWGGTEGDLATAHGGPGHSKSVSFGGDPSRLFKRVHYRLVNASAEGETLLTALNSLRTQSPSHSLTQTHTPTNAHTRFLLPLRCVFLMRCEWLCCLLSVSSVFFDHVTHPSLPLSPVHEFHGFGLHWKQHNITKCTLLFHWSERCESERVILYARVRLWPVSVWVQCVKCVKHEGFFEDVFWNLEGDSGVCYCIFRTVCEGLLREYVCVKF